jgi:hypothetical protein
MSWPDRIQVSNITTDFPIFTDAIMHLILRGTMQSKRVELGLWAGFWLFCGFSGLFVATKELGRNFI